MIPTYWNDSKELGLRCMLSSQMIWEFRRCTYLEELRLYDTESNM